MKKCPYCAEEIQDATIVCRYCGRDLNLENDKETGKVKSAVISLNSAPVICPNCNRVNSHHNAFCSKCGFNLEMKTELEASPAPIDLKNAAQEEGVVPGQPKENAIPELIVLVLVLVLACITAVFSIVRIPGYVAGGGLEDTIPSILIILGILYFFVDVLLKSEKRLTLVHSAIVYFAASWVMFFVILALLDLFLGELEKAGTAFLFGVVALWPWHGIYNIYDRWHLKAVVTKLLREGRVADLERWVAMMQKEQ